ncbi:hypothetical protein P8452_44698 [Trifolium repens]|nr:hypothetical protein P8452_44698 [Trifolium repens]
MVEWIKMRDFDYDTTRFGAYTDRPSLPVACWIKGLCVEVSAMHIEFVSSKRSVKLVSCLCVQGRRSRKLATLNQHKDRNALILSPEELWQAQLIDF